MTSAAVTRLGVFLLYTWLQVVHGARLSWMTADALYPFYTPSNCTICRQWHQPSRFESSMVHLRMTPSNFPDGWTSYNCSRGSIDGSDSWPKFTLDWRIMISTVIAFVGATLANSAGVGGGGLFVPMFRLLIGFDTKTSAALSKSMIMGGAIASAFYNLSKKHPKQDKPMIDYDLALLIQPMLLFGISVGVMSNVIFPDWVLTILLVFILLGMAFKSIGKGVCVWKEESRAKQVQQSYLQTEDFHVKGLSDDRAHPEVSKREDNHANNGECGALFATHNVSCSRSLSPLEKDSLSESFGKVIMWKHVGALSLVWIVYLGLQLAKLKTKTCSTSYWALNVSQLPVSLVATTFGIWRVLNKHQESSLKEELLESTATKPKLRWKSGQLLLYPCLATLAGVVGGFLGIGGGMVLAPAFLEFGVIPQVSAATTTFIVVFSSSMSVVEFYLLGRLPLVFGAYFCAVCAFSAVFGLHTTQYFVRRYNRTSFIIFVLALIIGASATVLGIFGGIEDLEKFMAGGYMGFCSFCPQ